MRGPQQLHSLQRAVTARDFELAALYNSRAVARAKALTRAALWAFATPGTVEVLLVPYLEEEKRGGGQVTVEVLSEHQTTEARSHVQQTLNERRPLGTTCLVNWAHYKTVRVTARIVVRREEDPQAIKQRVIERLHQTINPLPTQFSSTGWPFGQALRASHIYDVALAEPGVRWVDRVRLVVDEVPEGNVAAIAADTTQQRTWYVGSGSTLFRSLNDGEGWEPAGRFPDEEITGVQSHPGCAGLVAAAWLTLLGEAERNFASTESHQFVVQITLPPGAPAGDYTFRLDMVDLANPDDDFSEGPAVKFMVAPSAPVKKPFPWWIVAVVVGLLILVGGGTYGIIQLSQKKPAVTPTVTVTKPTPTAVLPTPTPKPVFAGPWQGQFTFNTGRNSAQSLQLSTLQNGAFRGTLFGPGFGEGPSSTNVSGTEGSLNSFSFGTQNRLKQAINQNGNGAGIYVEFTAISYGNIPGIFPLNSVFEAVVYADGSLHGVWFNPGDTQPDGIFTLNKSS